MFPSHCNRCPCPHPSSPLRTALPKSLNGADIDAPDLRFFMSASQVTVVLPHPPRPPAVVAGSPPALPPRLGPPTRSAREERLRARSILKSTRCCIGGVTPARTRLWRRPLQRRQQRGRESGLSCFASTSERKPRALRPVTAAARAGALLPRGQASLVGARGRELRRRRVCVQVLRGQAN